MKPLVTLLSLNPLGKIGNLRTENLHPRSHPVQNGAGKPKCLEGYFNHPIFAMKKRSEATALVIVVTIKPYWNGNKRKHWYHWFKCSDSIGNSHWTNVCGTDTRRTSRTPSEQQAAQTILGGIPLCLSPCTQDREPYARVHQCQTPRRTRACSALLVSAIIRPLPCSVWICCASVIACLVYLIAIYKKCPGIISENSKFFETFLPISAPKVVSQALWKAIFVLFWDKAIQIDSKFEFNTKHFSKRIFWKLEINAYLCTRLWATKQAVALSRVLF